VVTGLFLAGELRPAGLAIAFLRRPIADVRTELIAWRGRLGQELSVSDSLAFPTCVERLDPYEMPWTTELLIGCGDWCAYTNNAIGGGDLSGPPGYLSRALGCDVVHAVHVPKHPPGHASTQFGLVRPDGTSRTLAAHAEDGRWSWHAAGEQLSFERSERYTARLIRERLDRELLVEYLGALGIRVDDPGFYGTTVAVRRIFTFPRQRRETAAQTRASFGW
jgi:hypothetical protein